MDAQLVLGVIFRWLHILAAIVAVGGSIFMRMALLPASEGITDDARRTLFDRLRQRWSKFVAAAILFLLISGFYNFIVVVIPQIRDTRYAGLYHGLFGLKFLLALALFGLASLLSGRSEAAQRFRQHARRWYTITALLGVAIVCISGVLRSIPREAKLPPAAAPVVAPVDESDA